MIVPAVVSIVGPVGGGEPATGVEVGTAAVTDVGPAAASEVETLGTVPAKKPNRKRIKKKVNPKVYPSGELPSVKEDEAGETEAAKESEETEAEKTKEQAEDREAAKDSNEEEAKESDNEDGEDGSTSSSPDSSSDEQLYSEEEEDNSVPEFEEHKLTVSTALTVDEDLCLKYFLGGGDKP